MPKSQAPERPPIEGHYLYANADFFAELCRKRLLTRRAAIIQILYMMDISCGSLFETYTKDECYEYVSSQISTTPERFDIAWRVFVDKLCAEVEL